MIARATVIISFVLLLAVPMFFRPGETPMPDDALTLIIVTPHNEQIRYEFARGFDQWVSMNFTRWPPAEQRQVLVEAGLIRSSEQAFQQWVRQRRPVRAHVIYSVPGGTSEIRKMLEAQYAAAFENAEEPGGNADLVFGGGSYEHDRKLKGGVTVIVDGEQRNEPITASVDFNEAWLDDVYGRNAIGDTHLYDPERHWFGTALSGFGIVFNYDLLSQLGLDQPTSWDDLCDSRLRGWVALVNPNQSGSIATTFEAILQRVGWQEGWEVLRRAGANARYFSGSSLKPPTDVSQGDAAMGICIDFYGRYQAQALAEAGYEDRVGYIDPPGVTTIDPDPISMLRGAPHPALARKFIEFTLTDQGQSLWQFRADEPVDDLLGPERFELRRMPVRRAMYRRYQQRMIDEVNPFQVASPLENPDHNVRSFIPIIFAAMTMDTHDELKEAWNAIVTHPAYPVGRNVVRAADVNDPLLEKMLALFDAMPMIRGPGQMTYSMETADHRAQIKAGWLDKEWAEAELWPREASPADAMRRRFADYFRRNYREIVLLSEAGD